MLTQQQLIETIADKVSLAVGDAIRQNVNESVMRELSTTTARLMHESEFHRRLSEEMRDGLKGIYREISNASAENVGFVQPSVDAQQLFNETTAQLDAVMQTVLEATESIMETTERLLEQQEEAGDLIATLHSVADNQQKLSRLDKLNQELGVSLTDIITSLSFQDLTGQRLKKVVNAIGTIRQTVFDLYVSTGLMLKHREEKPEKNITELKAETQKAVEKIRKSELKGPSNDGVSQQAVDNLLADLGM